MTRKLLLIADIRLEHQRSENLIDEDVEMYAAAMSAGETIQPVEVRFDGQNYWLWDGFHRVAAAVSIGRLEIEADITPGTFPEMRAEWYRKIRAALDKLHEENLALKSQMKQSKHTLRK